MSAVWRVSVKQDLWSMRITDRLAQIPAHICSANWRTSVSFMWSSLLLSAVVAFTLRLQITVDRQILRCLNSSSENVDRRWSVRWWTSTFISSYDDKMDDLFVFIACTVTKWPRDKSAIFGMKCIINWKRYDLQAELINYHECANLCVSVWIWTNQNLRWVLHGADYLCSRRMCHSWVGALLQCSKCHCRW